MIIPTGTTPQDYTPWLRAILEQLQTLDRRARSHCVHLQEEMQTSVNELQDTLIYIASTRLESQIWDLFNGLEDYLHDLAAWLAEQLVLTSTMTLTTIQRLVLAAADLFRLATCRKRHNGMTLTPPNHSTFGLGL